MMLLALDLFCKSQMSIQTTAISGLENALMILGFDTSTMLLKICVSLITSLIILKVIGRLVLLRVYGRPRIFKYNLDLGRQGLSM